MDFLWIFYGLLAALSLTAIYSFTKKYVVLEESLEFTSSVRFLVFLFSLPLIFVFFNASLYDVVFVYVASLINMVAYWLASKSIKHLTLSFVSPILNLEVVFVLLFAWLFYNESLSFNSLIGIFVVLLAIGAISVLNSNNYKKHSFSTFAKYASIALIAAFYYGLFKIMSRYMLYYKSLSFMEFFVLLNIFNALNGLLLLFLVEGINPFVYVYQSLRYNPGVYVVSFFTILQIVGEYMAYLLAPKAVFVSLIRSLYVVFNEYVAWFMFNEKQLFNILLSIIAFIGVVIALIG